AGNRALVDALHGAAKHRAGDDRRVHHVRHFEIDSVLRRAVDLERHVEPRQPATDELELIWRLDRGLLVELDRGRLDREFAIAERAAGRLVRDLAHRRSALGRGHAPALRRRRDQALTRARPGLLDQLAGLAHRAAAAGAQATVDLVVPEITIGGSVFRLDERPVAFELLGEDLRERGETALPHLGAAVADDDGIVGLDHHPGVDLAGIAFGVIAPGTHAEACSLRRARAD